MIYSGTLPGSQDVLLFDGTTGENG